MANLEKDNLNRPEGQEVLEGTGSFVINNVDSWNGLKPILEDPLVRYLQNVVTSAPYYSRLMNNLDINYDNFNSFPFSTPEELMENPEEFVNKQTMSVQIASTSGTYGKGKVIYRTNKDLDRSVETTVEMFSLSGIKENDRVAILQPFDLWNIGHIALNTFRRMNVLSLPVGLSSDDEEILQLISSFRVNVVYGTPSKILSLVEKTQNINLSISKVLCAGEPLLPKHRETIKKIWGAETFGIYGSEETDGIGAECELHQGYHTPDENLIIEILDPSTLTYSNKNEGAIAVTKLGNTGTVLVRYLLGDIVKVIQEPCACGSKLVRIQPTGRLKETLWLYDGTKVPIHSIEKLFMELIGNLPSYQVVVTKDVEAEHVEFLMEIPEGKVDSERLLRSISGISRDVEEGVRKGKINFGIKLVKDIGKLEKTKRGKIPKIIYKGKE